LAFCSLLSALALYGIDVDLPFLFADVLPSPFFAAFFLSFFDLHGLWVICFHVDLIVETFWLARPSPTYESRCTGVLFFLCAFLRMGYGYGYGHEYGIVLDVFFFTR
jgi:hypothetical protein